MPSKLLSAPLLIPALIIVLDLIGTQPALAQAHVATLDDLRRELAPGDVVSLVETGGGSVKGRLLRFGDSDLDIGVESQAAPGQEHPRLNITVPINAIRSLERLRDPSGNGALIGAAVGGGIVLGMLAWAFAVDANEADEWGPSYAAMGGLCTGIGAAAGWAIDRAHSKPPIRFYAPSTARLKIRAAPLLARGRGMSVVVSF